MFQGVKIKIRDIKELQENDVATPQSVFTPLKKRKNLKSTNTTKKFKKKDCDNDTVNASNFSTTTITKTGRKKLKSALKETPSNQKRIDSFFTSCPKTYAIKLPKEELQTPSMKSKTEKIKSKATGNRNKSAKKRMNQSPRRPKVRRKRLFTDSTEPSAENMSNTSYLKNQNSENNIECITIDSDSEEENNIKKEFNSNDHNIVMKDVSVPVTKEIKISTENSSPIASSSVSFGQQLSKTSCEITNSIGKSSISTTGRRKIKPCPPYKIIENTTFAVDAFQFGYIDNVTHYFLTHFHADHYIGLTKSFSMPLFVSPVTARLLRAFIRVEEQFIHEIELNESIVINNIEITPLDANHCPGSVMYVFKFLDTGKCILHTGDFRASPDMESEPIFWNNHIHTIYLDTTYISDKYVFCTQYESIEKAHDLIDKFMLKHCWRRVLYICGSYLVGKERFWSSLAEELNMKVWTEGNRRKALNALNDERYNRLLVDDPSEANMHILSMVKLSYLELVEYFKKYEHQYDVLFALRPSGWEKDTKPRYGSKINLIGVEYSEHSSYAEMERFVKFLKPNQVISTVASGRNLMKTPNVPLSWYKYDKLKASSNYQPTIDSLLGKTPQRQLNIRLPNANKGGVEHFVSPFKSCTPQNNNKINNSSQANEIFSIISSQPTEIRDKIEEIRRHHSPTNVQNDENLVKNTYKKTLAQSNSNSSEDFEKSDFIIKTKNFQKNKKNVEEKCHNKSLTKPKQKRHQKQLIPKNISGQDEKIGYEELYQTPDAKIKKENKLQIENGRLNISSDKELNNFKVSSPLKRITRSQNSFNKLTNNSLETKINQYDESFESTSDKKSKTKSINSTSDGKTISFDLEFPISQKRVTRSKAATNSSKTTITPNSQNNNEPEFESKLFTKTQQNNIQITSKSTKSQLKSTINLNNYQENGILKSTTNSSIDRLSYDETHSTQLNSTKIKDNFLDEFAKLPKISTKRNSLNRNLTTFKKTKTTFDTQTILNTILEQGESFERFDCSQLAGLVVEKAYQQNSDNSKDHIPADLLSDADDDWM